MRVAVVQFAAGRDKQANLERLRALVADAAGKGAQLVVCPEASMHTFGRPTDPPLAEVAETLDGAFVTGLAETAAAYGVTVVAGMFETADGDRSRAYNTVVALRPHGVIGRYRKLHLFDALGWVESDRLVAGPLDQSSLLTFPCAEVTVGVMTCYDLRFPELGRALADAGTTLLALPSAWVAGPLKEEQWLTLVRARAIENTCYVAAADQCAPDYAGRSVVVDPAGVPLVQLLDEEGVAVADVSGGRVGEVRARMPSLTHRRFSVQPTGG